MDRSALSPTPAIIEFQLIPPNPLRTNTRLRRVLVASDVICGWSPGTAEDWLGRVPLDEISRAELTRLRTHHIARVKREPGGNGAVVGLHPIGVDPGDGRVVLGVVPGQWGVESSWREWLRTHVEYGDKYAQQPIHTIQQQFPPMFFGVGLLLITIDGYLVFARRSAKLAADPGCMALSVGEGALPTDLFHGQFDPVTTAMRGAAEELGIRGIPRERFRIVTLLHNLRNGRVYMGLTAHIDLTRAEVLKSRSCAEDGLEGKLKFIRPASTSLRALMKGAWVTEAKVTLCQWSREAVAFGWSWGDDLTDKELRDEVRSLTVQYVPLSPIEPSERSHLWTPGGGGRSPSVHLV